MAEGTASSMNPRLIGLAALLLACSSNPGNGEGSGGQTAAGGGANSGGVSSSGGHTSGGSNSAGGIGLGGSTGGQASGGGPGAGGTNASGGAPSSGGDSASAGRSMGGIGAGGVGSGGTSAGGTASGGALGANGGRIGAGGASSGGTSAGGASSGGASAGGSANGGAANAGGSAGASGGAIGFAPCPTTAATPCAVLPLGDSITEGYGSSGGGYRVELFRQAVQNGKNVTFVGSLQNGPNSVENRTFPKRHEGHGGYTIDSDSGHSGISGSITDQAIANYHPHIVLLMIGTNDINGNVDVNAAPNRLGNLIDDITTRAPSALVVVATIIPIANDGTNARVKTYNTALAGVVSTRANAGKHVLLLDNYAAFSKDVNYKTALMYDYLHPNDAGYAVLGRSFYSVIASLLPMQ